MKKYIEMTTGSTGQTSGTHSFAYLDTDRALDLEPDSRYLVTAIKLPDGYRMVTEEDRKHPKPDCVMYLLAGKWYASRAGEWVKTLEYAIPIDYKIEPEEPEVKAFEILWGGYPEISGHTSQEAKVGAKVGNYRIFGFGNGSKFFNRYNHTVCNCENNWKYAYGRLEK